MLRSSKILLLSALVLAFTACTKATKDPDGVNGNHEGEAGATFDIESVEGNGTFAEIFPGVAKSKLRTMKNWNVPSMVNFTITACISDRNTNKDARFQDFAVEEVETKRRIDNVKPKTTRNGCFWWIEQFPFNYFVERSKWVVVERDIIGTNLHVGRKRIKLALNPWAVGGGARDDGDAVRYLRDKPLAEDVLVTSSDFQANKLGEDELYADRVNVRMIREGEHNTGMFLRVNVEIEPRVRFRNHAGLPAKEKTLGNGEFDVIGHLVARHGKGNKQKIILTSPEKLQLNRTKDKNGKSILVEDKHAPELLRGYGRMIDGKLIARMNAYVDARIPQGNLELVIMLIPRGVRGLKPLEGIYELGPLNNLASQFSGPLNKECRDDDQCDIYQYLKNTENFYSMVNKSFADSNAPYLFDRLKLRFVKVDANETATQRKVRYAASTCVIDAYTGERPIGLAFNITYKTPKADGSYEVIRNRKTEEDGCLNWDSTIDHKYYDPEQFFEQVVVIEKSVDDPNEEKVSREMKFHINPWDDKFTFGFDEREFREEFWEMLAKAPKIKSRFFMADFGYHTVRFQYNIDDLMGLEVRKTVLMELEPRVLRYSGIVNARKMTEPMRDGIWLMKVAIQKDYLDPAAVGGRIEKRGKSLILKLNSEKEDQLKQETSERLRRMGIKAPVRQYITTQTALVRSTDGVIIKPVEMKMQDLRLMRVRSNFLIQMETVNERTVWAENRMRQPFQDEREKIAREAEALAVSLGEKRETAEGSKIIANFVDQRRKELMNIRTMVRSAFKQIVRMLKINDAESIPLDKLELTEAQRERLRPYLERLNIDLKANDFTEIGLPKCTPMNKNCDDYLEPASGLSKRTFVGPVIFLQNAYKDSVRATDNLDEACNVKTSFKNQYEADMYVYEETLFDEEGDEYKEIAKNRKNTFYDYSQFFGSLSHLCNKDVDWLIQEERKDRRAYEMTMKEQASVYNFVKSYGLDYLSLGDFELPKAAANCRGSSDECMYPTDDFTHSSSEALKWMNARRMGVSQNQQIEHGGWNQEHIRRALFGPVKEEHKRFAGCALVTGQFGTHLRAINAAAIGGLNYLEYQIMDACLRQGDNAVFFDRKLRVEKTADSNDPYLFLGGYQLNVNVGQGFSVSRSDSYSWGWSVDGLDFIGGPFGMKNAASAIKPLTVKLSKSQSLSDSAGSSISESTYLVAQIAKFDVKLDKYERCVVLRFTNQFLRYLALNKIIDISSGAYGPYRGLFVCEGRKIEEPRKVKETYFYFTQHFTEGDMLDQADLYNHPWLLALRGYRDFGTFLSLIRKQEAVTIGNFVSGVFNPQVRDFSWPLAHMRDAFREITPSFPGIYTELEDGEKGPEFPLETERLSKFDIDPNNEVVSAIKKIKKEDRRGN